MRRRAGLLSAMTESVLNKVEKDANTAYEMSKRGISESVKHVLWTIAWMHCASLGQCACEKGRRGTVIGLRETVASDEVTRIGRGLAKLNYSNVKFLPNLRMVSGCGPSRNSKDLVRGIGEMEWVEDDGRVEVGSWALDRLDQRSLPLDNRVYDASRCIGRDGSKVEAFVIDTGCDITHKVFAGRRISSIDISGDDGIDENGHGTEIASLLNGRGIGVARGMSVTCIKALNRNGVGFFSDIVQGIEIALSRKREGGQKGWFVVMSLTGVETGRMMGVAVERAGRQGVISFAAAGNQGRNACDYSPGREAIGIGAVGRDDKIVGFSNWGMCVDGVGPGKGVTVDGNGGMRRVSGTSYAVPLVAGLVGVMWEGGGVEEAKRIIEKGTKIGEYRMPVLECFEKGKVGIGGWTIVVAVMIFIFILIGCILYVR